MSFSSLSKDLHQVFVKNSKLISKADKSNNFVKSLVTSEAAKQNCKDNIDFLTKLGVEVNLGNHLTSAVIENDVNLAEFFLENGAGLQCLGTLDRSVKLLHLCYFSSRKTMLKLLLDYGLDKLFRKKFRRNALIQFIAFLGSCDSNCVNSDTVGIAEILINSGISVNEVDDLGYSPLIHCLRIDNAKITDLVRLLIKKGANVNYRVPIYEDIVSTTPLVAALFEEKIDLFDLLLSNGSDINAVDNDGWTTLHLACANNIEAAVEKLIHKGADVNILDCENHTAFMELYVEDETFQFFECMCIMVREFSKLSFKNLFIHPNNITKVQQTPDSRGYFKRCLTELNQMTDTKFYSNYSYYSVLEMSKNIKKLANLSKNKEFVSKFLKNINKFPCYESELRKILEEATEMKNKSMALCSELYKLFKDSFPDVVIRNLTRHLTLEDLPSQ